MRSRIAAEILPPGFRLPPERTLAACLSVSRTTLVAALDLLRAEGLVETRHGSGTRVAGPDDGATPARPTMIDRLLTHGRDIDLAASAPGDARHLPPVSVSTGDLLNVTPSHGYAPQGLGVLREAVARYFCTRGLPTRPEEVLVTHGSQQAIDLAFAALLKRRDAVAVEDPTYPGVLDVLDARGARHVPLPADQRWPTAKALEEARGVARVSAAFLMPSVHHPTGRVMNRARREALAQVLDRLELPVVEDATLADLAFDGIRPPLLASICRKAPVITVASVTGVAWGGLRVGWLRASASVVERALRLRAAADLGCSVPAQLLVVGLLERWDELEIARRAQLARAAACITELLANKLPEWSFEVPAGGLSLWVRLPTRDAGAFAQQALRHGVAVGAGEEATRTDEGHRHLRICYDRPENELREGVERLAAAWLERGKVVPEMG